MKHLNEFIIEKLRINKDTKVKGTTPIKYFPKDLKELRNIIYEEKIQHGDYNLNDIDVSNITDMSHLFRYGFPDHFIFLEMDEWDVSNVTKMAGMFGSGGLSNFNTDISDWDVSNVTDMDFMFDNCEKFDCDLSKWKPKSLLYCKRMFYKCRKFDYDLSNWDCPNIREPWSMFELTKMEHKTEYLPKWYYVDSEN